VIRKAKQINRDVGVVLCDCGGTLRDRLNFERLQQHLAQLPVVATIELCSKFCQPSECIKVIASLFQSEKQVKRLVIGACDQQMFEKTLGEATQGSRLNQGPLWSVNIREHCAWVTSAPDAATNRSIELLTAAIRRVKLASAVKFRKARINRDVLVLGGSVAAMQTAVALSRLGHRVSLIESSQKLGGVAAQVPELYAYVAANSCDAESVVQSRVNELIGQVRSDKRIRVHTSSSLKSIEGEFGGFTAVVSSNGTEQKVSTGAIVLAADSVAMSSGLAELIHNGFQIPKRVAIVMDVLGEQGRATSAQVLSAAELLAKRFGAEVKLYCHNVRVAATGLEGLYRRARQAGVVVVKYEEPPVILDEGLKKVLHVEEPIIGYQFHEDFDLVINADAPAGSANNELLSLMAGLRAGPAGVLQFDSVWLLPTETNREGVFVVGSARGDGEFRDAQADALVTANKIHQLLKNGQIEIPDDAALVDEEKCVLCLTCLRICPHGAVSIDVDNAVASVSPISCQRCGVCAAQCPANAIQLPRFTDEQIAAELGDKPKTIIFACENSAYPAATAAAINGSVWAQAVELIRVPCAGKVDPRAVLQALELGAEKVMILGCHQENCQYLVGSTWAAKRIERLKCELERAGVSDKRVVFGQLASLEPHKFLEYVS